MPSSSDGGPSPSRGSSPSSPSNPSRRSPPPQSEPDASPAATHQPTAAEGTRSGGRLAGSCSWGKILEKRAKRALILSGPRHGVKSDRLLALLGDAPASIINAAVIAGGFYLLRVRYDAMGALKLVKSALAALEKQKSAP